MPNSLSRRRLDGLLLAFALTGMLGCVGPQRVVEKAVYCCEAKKAYKACGGGCSLDCESERHFERGWRRGYVAAALGRDHCPPALPPQPYLGKRYQSPGGQQLTSLWFAGYEEGALAAKRCGRGPQVVTHEVGCREGCEGSCLSPMPGVLPDAKHTVALQAASYLEPLSPIVAPSIAPPEAEPAPADARGEAVPPPAAIKPQPLETPVGPTAQAESSTQTVVVSLDTPPTAGPNPRSREVSVAHRQVIATEPLGYEASPTTRLAFPGEPGDLPPVKTLPTSAGLPVAEPKTEPKPNEPKPRLAFPAAPGDLPAVPVMGSTRAAAPNGTR